MDLIIVKQMTALAVVLAIFLIIWAVHERRE